MNKKKLFTSPVCCIFENIVNHRCLSEARVAGGGFKSKQNLNEQSSLIRAEQ